MRRFLATKKGPAQKQGMAMLLVIFALAIISALVVEIIYRSQLSAKIVANRRDGEKAYELARAAFRWSVFRIQLDDVLDQIPEIPGTNYGGRKDDLSEVQWAVPLPYPLSPELIFGSQVDTDSLTALEESQMQKSITEVSELGGTFMSVIEDESGKINLNDVGISPFQGGRASAMTEILENLLQSPRFSLYFNNADYREIIWSIDDWTDSDSTVNHLGGGIEDAEYQTDDNDANVKNAPFFTVREARLLKPMTKELFEELEPFITVYPFNARLPRTNTQPGQNQAKINVNTAPLEIIAALFDRRVMPWSNYKQRYECAKEIVNYRKGVVFRSIDKNKEPSFYSAVETLCGQSTDTRDEQLGAISPLVRSVLALRSNIFAVKASGVVQNTERMIHAIVSRQNPAKPLVLYWRVS